MKPSVAFFTVTHYKDYDFLLGSIEHHARMGYHLVLDTSPREHAAIPSGLPETVRWIHEPLYGSGWKQFKMRTAVDRACALAREFGTDVLASLDSDEFYSEDSPELLFPHAARHPVSVHCTHWKSDGLPYMFGKSEWHLRLWPRNCDVRIAANLDWTKHPDYNGNPEHHPVPVPPAGRPEIRVPGNFHHHVHYAFSPDFDSDAGARMIDGWPDGGFRVPVVPWPHRLRMWQAAGIKPSTYYMAQKETS
jgi:hypothetical protein